MKRSIILLVALWVILVQNSMAQITIKGNVTAQDDGEPLPGVNLRIKGSDIGTITNIEGKYSIRIDNKDVVIIFSFIGYDTLEQPVGENTSIDVILASEESGIKSRISSLIREPVKKPTSIFKVKQITVFKTGVALFEKESIVNVKNNKTSFNCLPFNQGQARNQSYYNNYSPTNIVLGTVNFYAEKNIIQEVRVFPDSFSLIFEKSNEKQQIKLNYIQNGLLWVPSYDVSIKDNHQGYLTLNAIVMNDIEDIEGADFNFAVGYPYFPYSNNASPLASKRNVAEMLQSIKTQGNNINTYNEQYKNNDAIVIGYGTTKKNHVKAETSAVTQQTDYEDLFFYSKPNFSIRKNESIKLLMTSFEINYEDIYCVDMQPSTYSVSYRGVTNSAKQKNVIWHSIKFKNTTNAPLTSGIAYFHKEIGAEIKYLSQGQLNHTSSGEYITTRVSITPDILVRDFDSQLKGEPSNSNNEFMVRGEIEINNLKKTKVKLFLKRDIYGTMLKSDTPWEYNSSPNFSSRYNADNTVSWSVEVEPNSKKKIEYVYSVVIEN